MSEETTASDEAVTPASDEAVTPASASEAPGQETPKITSTSMFALKPLDDLERKLTMIGGGLGVALSIGLWAPQYFEIIALLGTLMGSAMALLLIWAARRRSRFLSGLATFLFAMGVPLEFAGVPWLALGMWLWIRGRPSPQEAAERRRLRQEQVAARRAAKRGEAPATTTGRTPPKPSKRYTPPARKR